MPGLNIWISGFLFTASLTTLLIAIYSVTKNNVLVAKPFAFLCISSTIYSFGYAMELLNSDINIIIKWNLFQYVGIEFIPVFWALLAIHYCGMDRILTRFTKSVLFGIPVMILAIRYTNSLHHLFYAKIYMENNGFFQVMRIEKGPLYVLNAAFITVSILGSNLMYLRLLTKGKGRFRYQSIIMFIASLFPLSAYFLLITNLSPLGIDFAPVISTFSYFLLLFGLMRYRFLDLVPLAHNKVFESIKDAVIVLDSGYNIIDFNPAAAVVFSELDNQAVGKSMEAVISGHDEFIQLVSACKESQYEIKSDKGSTFYNMKISVLYGKFHNIVGYIIMLNNITKHVENMNRLQLIAAVDGLTAIYNRRHFMEACKIELEKARAAKLPVALIMLDIDDFKRINDKSGHQAGDAVLKDVADICRLSIRTTDILARFGGEEFIIFLPETQIERAAEIAGRLRERIEKLSVVYGKDVLSITASFGVAGADKIEGESIDLLIKIADEALYMAKRNGRNCLQILPVPKESEIK